MVASIFGVTPECCRLVMFCHLRFYPFVFSRYFQLSIKLDSFKCFLWVDRLVQSSHYRVAINSFMRLISIRLLSIRSLYLCLEKGCIFFHL